MKLVKMKIIIVVLLSGLVMTHTKTEEVYANKQEKQSIKEQISSLVKKHKEVIIGATTGILGVATACYMLYKKYNTLNSLHLVKPKKEKSFSEEPLYYQSEHVPFLVSEKEELKLDSLFIDYEKTIKNNYSAKRKFQATKQYFEYIIQITEKYWKAHKGIAIVYQSESWAKTVENNIRQFTQNLNELDISSNEKTVFITYFNDTTFNSLSTFENRIEKLGLDKYSPKIIQNLRSLFHESLIEKELLRRLVK